MPESPVAVVTGGARRVGAAIVETLARAGYRVAIHAHRSVAQGEQLAAKLAQAGSEAKALAAELREPAEVRGLIERVIDDWGRIDVWVNSAAIWEAHTLEETTPDDLRRHWEVNTLATFVAAQQAGLQMVRQTDGGVIVNVGDWAVIRPYLNYAAYFAAKGSIETITRTLAVELGTRNPRVRVNCVLPGPVLLPPEMSADERGAVVNQTLVRREGTPEHVASAVRFLIENDFVTGVSLPVDGGRSVFAAG